VIYAVKDLIQRPYPYYIPFSRSFKLILWFSIGFPVFYLIVQPFGVVNWQCEYKNLMILGMALPVFSGLSLNFYGLTRVFPRFFEEDHWTVGREILWSIWNIITLVLLVNLFYQLLPVCGTQPGASLTSTLTYGILVGALPSFICIQYNQLQAVKRKLKKLEALNAVLSQRQGIVDNEVVVLEGENESLNVGLNDLILIEAQDNYSNVIWHNGKSLKQRLLRGTLKSMEQQLDFHFIKRCHRSFMVNLSKVSLVTGNSRGYKLSFTNLEKQIPVSRELSKSILKELDELDLKPQLVKSG